jgi:5-methylthioadenosine/S-adenosylhomocysteine deaminase
MDLAIINSWVMTCEGKGLGIIKNGGVGVENGRIVFLGKMDEFNYKNAERIIDGKYHHLAMPGLINSHIHSILTLCRGAVHDIPEIEYIPKGLNFFAEHLTFEDFILGTKIAVIEGLKAGTTTFVEYGLGVAGLVNHIYKPYHLSVVPTEMINELSYYEELKPDELYNFHTGMGKAALRRANKLFKQFEDEELIKPMYGPQALDMLSLELLHQIKENAIQRHSKMHMHVAQGERERIQIKKRFGKNQTTVKVLENEDLLGNYLIAAHIHDTTHQERKLLVEKGVGMVGCPSSISKIDGIVPPLADYVELGGIAGIGTDEAPGTGHHNLFNEMKMASLLSKVNNKNPMIMPPWVVIKLATINAAKLLGLDHKIGSLKIGKRADIITIDLKKPHLTPIVSDPFCNLSANLVYSNKGNEVNNVIINGKPIMLESQLIDFNVQEILDNANERAEIIFKKGKEDWIKSGSQMVKYYENGFI